MTEETDTAAVEEVVRGFFTTFTSGPGLAERMEALRALFLPGAVIVRTCGDLVTYDVDSFIAPRHALLAGGELTDFSEWPASGRVEVFGDVAHWFGHYEKAGRQQGQPFTGRGAKSIQLVRTAEGWRISAAAWDDERPA